MTVATRSARKPARVKCLHCSYSAEPDSSIAGHVAMAHPEVPMDAVAPKRSGCLAGHPAWEAWICTACGKDVRGPGWRGPRTKAPDVDVTDPKRSMRNATPPMDPELAELSTSFEHAAAKAQGAGAALDQAVAEGRWDPDATGSRLLDIPLDLVDIGSNVRVDVAALEELTASIAEHGVLQPVKVTQTPEGRYRLVWGQRRTLAARQAGLATIPAIVEAAGDLAEDGATRSIEQLVENLHRADLPALDRARAIRDVVSSGMSQADLARKLGIGASTVANDLGLLEAPAAVQELLEQGQLTPAHAKAMKGLAPKSQVELAREVAERGYSAHATEELVQRRKQQAEHESEQRKADHAALEARRQVVDAGIADQIAKGVDSDVVVIVASSSYYQADTPATWLVERLQAGGFKNARKAADWRETDPRPGGGVCDCKALHAKVTETARYKGGKRLVTYALRWSNACVVPAHRQAKERATEQKRLAKEATARRVQEHVKRTAAGWAIPEGRAIAIDRILAESALWGLLSYRIPTWAETHGGKKSNPFAAIRALTDEELAKELAMELASDFRDKAGYHIDWAALGAEIDAEAEA